MDCKWIPFGDKFKCEKCGFVVKSDKIHKNCRDIPSITKRAKNLSKAVVKHFSTGMQHCSDEEKQERFTICQSNKCGLFRPYGNSGDGICAHDDCGCFIRSNGKFLDKLSWADSKCPAGMWGPIEKNQQNDEKGV